MGPCPGTRSLANRGSLRPSMMWERSPSMWRGSRSHSPTRRLSSGGACAPATPGDARCIGSIGRYATTKHWRSKRVQHRRGEPFRKWTLRRSEVVSCSLGIEGGAYLHTLVFWLHSAVHLTMDRSIGAGALRSTKHSHRPRRLRSSPHQLKLQFVKRGFRLEDRGHFDRGFISIGRQLDRVGACPGAGDHFRVCLISGLW